MNPAQPLERIVFVVSGPSGSGKDSVIRGLLERVSDLRRITTYTTRPKRPHETQGTPYHFVDDATFDRLSADGSLFESETVYGSHRYGSPRELVEPGAPPDLILELDPHGYRRLRQARHGMTVGIFLVVPGLDDLRHRILRRYPESDLERRLAIATEQIEGAGDYDYLLLNDELERCCERATILLEAERIRRAGRLQRAQLLPRRA